MFLLKFIRNGLTMIPILNPNFQMRASMSQYLTDSDSDSEMEVDASKHNRFNKFKSSPKSAPVTDSSKRKVKPSEPEEINEKLELSISDVKVGFHTSI